MNLLIFLISLFLTSNVLSNVIVTVTHPHAVTVTFDTVLGRIIPPSSAGGFSQDQLDYAIEGTGTYSVSLSEDLEGKVNAKATASLTKVKSSMKSIASTLPTDATTDVNSAFKMSLPFAFGTAAAIILAAIVF